MAVEYREGRFSFKETFDLWNSLHFDRKEKRTVSYGTDVETETESRGFVTGEGIVHGYKFEFRIWKGEGAKIGDFGTMCALSR